MGPEFGTDAAETQVPNEHQPMQRDVSPKSAKVHKAIIEYEQLMQDLALNEQGHTERVRKAVVRYSDDQFFVKRAPKRKAPDDDDHPQTRNVAQRAHRQGRGKQREGGDKEGHVVRGCAQGVHTSPGIEKHKPTAKPKRSTKTQAKHTRASSSDAAGVDNGGRSTRTRNKTGVPVSTHPGVNTLSLLPNGTGPQPTSSVVNMPDGHHVVSAQPVVAPPLPEVVHDVAGGDTPPVDDTQHAAVGDAQHATGQHAAVQDSDDNEDSNIPLQHMVDRAAQNAVKSSKQKDAGQGAVKSSKQKDAGPQNRPQRQSANPMYTYTTRQRRDTQQTAQQQIAQKDGVQKDGVQKQAPPCSGKRTRREQPPSTATGNDAAPGEIVREDDAQEVVRDEDAAPEELGRDSTHGAKGVLSHVSAHTLAAVPVHTNTAAPGWVDTGTGAPNTGTGAPNTGTGAPSGTAIPQGAHAAATFLPLGEPSLPLGEPSLPLGEAVPRGGMNTTALVKDVIPMLSVEAPAPGGPTTAPDVPMLSVEAAALLAETTRTAAAVMVQASTRVSQPLVNDTVNTHPTPAVDDTVNTQPPPAWTPTPGLALIHAAHPPPPPLDLTQHHPCYWLKERPRRRFRSSGVTRPPVCEMHVWWWWCMYVFAWYRAHYALDIHTRHILYAYYTHMIHISHTGLGHMSCVYWLLPTYGVHQCHLQCPLLL